VCPVATEAILGSCDLLSNLFFVCPVATEAISGSAIFFQIGVLSLMHEHIVKSWGQCYDQHFCDFCQLSKKTNVFHVDEVMIIFVGSIT
jgi:hypothetical protein